MANQIEMEKLTDARTTVLSSATKYPPSAWVVNGTGGRVGLERVSWKKNIRWLTENGYLRESAWNDWYLTDKAEEYLRERDLHPEKFEGR